jgi:acetyl-CoA C-acetyltransferase
MTKPVICAAYRSAIGSFGSALAGLSAVEIATAVVTGLLERTKVAPERIDEVIVGTVLSAGQGQAPARQVTIKSGIPQAAHSLTINKVCSSGLAAIMLAADQVRLGNAHAIIAGGMESMSNAPYLLPQMRSGARYGNQTAEDSIIKDALWDVYHEYLMGNAAELCAKEKKITREAQDTFAIQSYTRAIEASKAGHFKNEIIPIKIKKGKEEVLFDTDEEPFKAALEKIPNLKPAFIKDGTVTAANASSLNDGAAFVLVCSEEFARTQGLTILASIENYGIHSQAPEWFTTAPIGAVEKVVSAAGLSLDAVDLYEINEAFSCVALACQAGLELPADKLNISGGAVALGHPVGSSGARILVTLIHNMQRLNKQTGAVGICNGGGEATSMLVRRV